MFGLWRKGLLEKEAWLRRFAAEVWRNGLVLATRNIRDFASFGVAVFNPWEAAEAHP